MKIYFLIAALALTGCASETITETIRHGDPHLAATRPAQIEFIYTAPTNGVFLGRILGWSDSDFSNYQRAQNAVLEKAGKMGANRLLISGWIFDSQIYKATYSNPLFYADAYFTPTPAPQSQSTAAATPARSGLALQWQQ